MDSGQELLDKLGRKRERILLLLYREDEVTTSDIRDECEIPRGSKEYHFGILEDDHGLIEEAGRVAGHGGIPERVWTLTDAGVAFVDQHLTEDRDRPEGHEARLDRVENQTDALRRDHDQLREDHDAIDERVDNGFDIIRDEFVNLGDDLSEVEREAADASNVKRLERTTNKQQAAVDRLRDQLEETTDDVDDVKQARARDQREIAALTERVDELETTLDDLREQLGKGMFSRLGGQ